MFQEEEDLMDKILWNFMLKKANNNLTYLTDYWRHEGIWLAGQTKAPFLFETSNFTWESRRNSWPLDGKLKLFHPVTGEKITQYGGRSYSSTTLDIFKKL